MWKNEDEESGSVCVALFNLSDSDAELSVELSRLGAGLTGEGCTLYELWDKTESAADGQNVTAMVEAHGVKVYRVTFHGA